MIIPVYEAKALFANIDQVCTAAVTFMMDLDKATPSNVAEICLKHVGHQSGSRLTAARVWDFRPVQKLSRSTGCIPADVSEYHQEISIFYQLYRGMFPTRNLVLIVVHQILHHRYRQYWTSGVVDGACSARTAIHLAMV
jgi:hypothetical protein